MFSKNNNITQSIYSIKNPFEKLATIVFAVLMAFLSLGLFLGAAVGAGILTGIIAVALFFRYTAISDGFKLDIENHTMSFPGGGNAANDISDYFNLNFLLQDFKRKSIDLDAISEIRRKDTKKTINGNVHETHYIEFVGTFGGTEVAFINKAKRDELYNAIRLSNGMGTPIFAATGSSNTPNTTTNAGGTVFGKSPTTSSAVKTNASASSFFGKKP